MSYADRAIHLMAKYPTIEDLARRAKNRMPHVAWEYLQTGTGSEYLADRNIDALRQLTIKPQLLKGELHPQLQTKLFNRVYDLPFGIAPGRTGLD